MRLIDMHCHLDLMANGAEIARAARERGIGFFCTTVTPEGARTAHERFRDRDNVRVGAGLHPWWIADGTCGKTDIAALEALVARHRYIGEVGLDGGTRGAASLAAQRDAFRRVARTAARNPLPGRVVSIHAVRTASTVLDILEETGLAARSTCIFHWFTGTSDELWRAVRAGCLFSINERMLATKRGREYARILPEEALLLETDAPPELGAPYRLDAIERSLASALSTLAEIRRRSASRLADGIAARSSRLLALR